jgi:hypothetical protein
MGKISLIEKGKMRNFIYGVIVVLSFHVANSMAFEVWGFKSGTSKELLKADADSRGEILDEKSDEVTNVLRRNSKTGNADIFLLSFCDSGLSSVSKVRDFTAENYANELYSHVKQYGSPVVSVDEKSLKNPAGTFEWKEVKYVWSTAGDDIQLDINVPTVTPFKAEASINIRHEDKSRCGKK